MGESELNTIARILNAQYFDYPGLSFKTPSIENAWEDWDLSTVLPAGAYAVHLIMARGSIATGIPNSVRKNGGTRLFSFTYPDSYVFATCELDANRIIEVIGTNGTLVPGDTTVFFVWGYWKK